MTGRAKKPPRRGTPKARAPAPSAAPKRTRTRSAAPAPSAAPKRARTRSAPPTLRILHVTPEAAPFARTGGLGDVAGALAAAQARAGANVSLLMPLYRDLELEPGLLAEEVDIGGALVVRRVEPWQGVRIYFVRHDPSFHREGLYGTAAGDYPDNARRFSWLAEAALALALRESPDILHLHDWQSALAAVLVQARPEIRQRLPRLRTLQSVHNLAYQGRAPRDLLMALGIPAGLGAPDLLGDGRDINLLKGGLVCADFLATVSGRYVKEIQEPEHGRGLHAVLHGRRREIVGIRNGIDMDAWNPAEDPVLEEAFSARSPRGKTACQRALAEELSLGGQEGEPIVGFIGRLVEQKGVELLLRALPEIAKIARVVIVGNGDIDRERAVAEAGRRSDGRIAVQILFDDARARRTLAGSDLILIPSRYEPCGLVQMYGMRYGALPVAHKVGGLAETIQDGKTGFLFSEFDDAHLVRAVQRAVRALRDPARRAAMLRAAMEQDFSWNDSVRAYDRLYRRVLRLAPHRVDVPAAQTVPLQTAEASTGNGTRAAGPPTTPATVPRRPVEPGEARVELVAQGPRRLYTYWQVGRQAAPAATPQVECRETGLRLPVGGSMPSGDGWIAAEPARHYRVVLGPLATDWVRTPPDVQLPFDMAASENLWALYLGPLGPFGPTSPTSPSAPSSPSGRTGFRRS